ncbi:hypothetical protein D049_0792A, partial [Vibrio parahaemolyticus VPTS-2010]
MIGLITCPLLVFINVSRN